LVEKPAGRNPSDIKQLIDATKKSGKILRVGFNHRFHPAMQEAKKKLGEGAVGPLMYIRARYGHGGRIGYDREWRANPKISGGGELLDQGVHLIDLCRWMGGEFDLQWGLAKTFFWDMPVEDNGFVVLQSKDKSRSAFLHASCTEWKNLFDFEIFGRTGKLEIWGLGKSYGIEELRYYRMKPEMGPPEIIVTPFPELDQSWQTEFNAFLSEIEGRKTDIATAEDALRTLEIVHQVYSSCNA
jgi:predicted dehydrogenase